MSVVLSISNQKGGVGKTTTCVNLGAGMARLGHKVLLIDMDPQYSMSEYMNHFGPAVADRHVGDWLMGRKSFADVVKALPFENMHLVPSSQKLTGDETNLVRNANFSQYSNDRFGPHMVLLRALDKIRPEFDYILIDAPPTFSLLFSNSIFASDRVLIPTKLEALSISTLGNLLVRIQDIKKVRNEVDVLGLFGTMYRQNIVEQTKCLEELTAKVPDAMMRSLIRANVTVAQAVSYKKPVQFFDAQSRGAKDYDALTEEVIARCNAELSSNALAR